MYMQNVPSEILNVPDFLNVRIDILKENAIAKSIIQSGFVNPVFVYKYQNKLWLLDGYHRLAALRAIYSTFKEILSFEETFYPIIPKAFCMPLTHEGAKVWKEKYSWITNKLTVS